MARRNPKRTVLCRCVKQVLNFRRSFLTAVFIGLFAMAARNVLDPDVWWHLKTGAWMLQHRAVPHADPFSYTRAGQPWVAHEWLFELAVYGIFRWAGYAGLIVAFAVIISAAFVPLCLRCRTDAVTAGTLTVWGALATTVVWGIRPQIISLLLLSVWLLILERSETNPKLLWWTLPLIVLWVNLHAGFILAPVFLALFIVGELIEMCFSATSVASSRLRWLGLTLLANLALVPLNPNGASIFRYPVDTLRSSPMQNHISEWASPDFHGIDYRAFFFLLLATFVVLAFSRRRVRARDLLLLLVGTVAALTAVRMTPLFVLIAVPLVARPVSGWLANGKTSVIFPNTGSALVNAGILALVVVLTAIHTCQVIWRQPQAEAAVFPTAAVAYLEQHPPEGPIFNYYSWGGYLIFKLYPRVPVFLDGRADVYGEVLTQYVDTYYLQKNWQQSLSDWKVTTVIVVPGCPLASALGEMPEWSLKYRDSVAAVFSKSLGSSDLQSKPLATLQPSP
jgi:hypothetical protein